MLTEFDRDKDEKLDKRRKFYIPHMKVMWQRNQKICEYGICSNFSPSKRGSHIFDSNFSP
jgi:hypothetical protein